VANKKLENMLFLNNLVSLKLETRKQSDDSQNAANPHWRYFSAMT